MLRIALLFTVAALFLLGPHRQARAETYHTCKGFIDSLPATIGTQGTWCLRKDLSTGVTSGNAITINTNNVTIDCNQFKIGGLAAGDGSLANGILAYDRHNATVRHCNIRGFYRGIHLSYGAGHLVEGNSLDGNIHMGIAVDYAPASSVRGNRILDTGGSTSSNAAAYGIYAIGGVDIIDNTVAGVAASGQDMSAYGIRTNSNVALIADNRVRFLAATGTGSIFGIYSSFARTDIRDNSLVGNGGVGIHCHTTTWGMARNNVVNGFDTAISNCQSAYNTINTL